MAERTTMPPPPSGDQWMADREVFAREIKVSTDHEGRERKYTELYITEAAKKRWSPFNPNGFTPDVALGIVQRARAGNYLEAIAGAVSVPRTTLIRWLALHEGTDCWEGKTLGEGGLLHDTKDLRATRREYYTAVGQVECDASAAILRLGHAGDERVLLEFLARRHPSRWRQRNSVIPENPDGTPLEPPPIKIIFGDGDDEQDPSGGDAKPATGS